MELTLMALVIAFPSNINGGQSYFLRNRAKSSFDPENKFFSRVSPLKIHCLMILGRKAGSDASVDYMKARPIII